MYKNDSKNTKLINVIKDAKNKKKLCTLQLQLKLPQEFLKIRFIKKTYNIRDDKETKVNSKLKENSVILQGSPQGCIKEKNNCIQDTHLDVKQTLQQLSVLLLRLHSYLHFCKTFLRQLLNKDKKYNENRRKAKYNRKPD